MESNNTKLRAYFSSFQNKLRTFPHRIYHHPGAFLILAFLIPFVLTALMYYFKGTYPFGNGSVLVLDLNGQYVYFYEEIQDVLRGESSLIYTWQRALGGEFLGIIAYYVASPFLILLLFFPEGYILDAIFFIFLCKAGAAGTTMAYYLWKRYPAKDKTSILLFSSLYATCAYMVVQGHNSMWIDELIWLPLLIYGIEQLIYKKKGILCSVMLGISLLSSFYIGYMMCIFAFFYFFYAYFVREDNNFYEEKQHFLRSLCRMAIYSLIGIAIAMVIIYPAYYSLQFGKNDFTTPDYSIRQNYTFLDILGKLFPGSFDTVAPEGLPFLYGGTLTLLLLPFFFVCKRVTAREKIAGGIAIAFFMISFNLSTVDLVWHGFQFPNWLNHRYSFMLTFFLVLFAYRAFCEIDRIRYHHLLAVCGVESLVLLIIQQTSERYNDYAMAWASLLCIAVVILSLYVFTHHRSKEVGRRVLCLTTALEMVLVGLLNLGMLDMDVGFTSRSHYMNFQSRFSPIIEKVQASDPTFYRMESTIHRMKNDPMQFNMRGLSHSTSTLNAKALTFMNRLGLVSVSNWSSYSGGNEATDSLLGLKYIITDKPLNDDFYQLYAEDKENKLYAYYNPYALSVAVAVNPAFGALQWSDDGGFNSNTDFYESACTLLGAMTTTMLGGDPASAGEYFTPITHTVNKDLCKQNDIHTDFYSVTPNFAGSCKIRFDLTVPDDNPIYLFVPLYAGFLRPAKISAACNNLVLELDTDQFYTEDSDRIIALGKHEAGDKIRITIECEAEETYFPTTDPFFFSLNVEKLKEAMTSLQSSQMIITEHSDTRLVGTINVPSDRTMLYTSIPYDKNWHVYIDGEEYPVYETAEALLAANIPAGTHTIELKYFSFEFYTGLAVSVCGIGALIGAAFYERHCTRRRKEAFASQMEIY